MKLLLVLALVALLPLAFAHSSHHHKKADIIDASNIDSMFASEGAEFHAEFQQFKKTYAKKYASPAHESHRFSLFQENMRKAQQLKKLNPTAEFGVNAFTDLHAVEFKNQYLNYRPAVGDAALLRQGKPTRQATKKQIKAIPTDFDWRQPGAGKTVGVTAVKDQGQCGSCWAFSATEAVESAWILAGNEPVALAPQQTVDCDTVDQGCNGGDTVSAYTYMEGVGLEAEASYPYTSGASGAAGTCAYNASAVVAKMTGFAYATPNCNDSCTNQNEAQLAESLYNVGPVSICVDASTWQTYQSGVLTAASGCQSAYSALDHCVQLVGYGTDTTTNQKYWSVRNSWNTSWGEAGYIRLLYGANTCGVADEATQVTAA